MEGEMTHNVLNGLLFFMTGAAIIYLFQVRRKQLVNLEREQLAEIELEDFDQLKLLLKTAYERMLYTGVLFLPLAFSSIHDGSQVSKLFFLVLIALLFLSNIPPRNRIIRLLDHYGLSVKDLRDRGIKI